MIRLTRPETGGAAEAIASVLKDGYLVQGRQVGCFERQVADFVGRGHAVAVSSGTAALQAALWALGVGPGDEVIVPDFTFPATANAAVACGATPVLADIDLATFNIDVASVRACLSPRTRAVMPVDLFGLACDLGSMGGLVAERGLFLVEDSACALGSAFRGRKCGSFGDASIISFHPRKIVTTGEGGMVLTDDQALADRVRTLRNHGIDVSAEHRGFVVAGLNLRMNEIEACLGLAQMEGLEGFIQRRRAVARQYGKLLDGLAEITAPVEPSGCFHTYQAYVVLIDPRIDRDRLIAALAAEGIETAIGTYAVHLQPYYRDLPGAAQVRLTQSEYAFRHSLALPIYPSMGEDLVEAVVAGLKKCLPLCRTEA